MQVHAGSWASVCGTVRAVFCLRVSKLLIYLVSGALPSVLMYKLTVCALPGCGGGEVELADGSTLPYDYLLLATGSSYSPPIKSVLPEKAQAAANVGSSGQSCAERELQTAAERRSTSNSSTGARLNRMQQLKCAAEVLKASNNIVVIGGGTVGVELAAEIVGKYGKDKAVTLITSKGRLLDRMPAKAGEYAAKWLQRNAVRIVYNERVLPDSAHHKVDHHSPKPTTVHTDKGRTSAADLVYDCTGSPANVQLWQRMTSSGASAGDADVAPVLASANQSRGVAVSPTLQVVGHPNVFACGDCMCTQFEKTAFTAEISAMQAARNIISMENGRRLMSYPEDVCLGASAPPFIACVSLYKHDGILKFQSMVLTGYFASMMKAIIERWQLAMARGSWIAHKAWNANESITLVLGRLTASGAAAASN